MTALIHGVPHEIDIDAEDEADGTHYSFAWVGGVPSCPACEDDLSPRLHQHPPTGRHSLVCDCGQEIEVTK